MSSTKTSKSVLNIVTEFLSSAIETKKLEQESPQKIYSVIEHISIVTDPSQLLSLIIFSLLYFILF